MESSAQKEKQRREQTRSIQRKQKTREASHKARKKAKVENEKKKLKAKTTKESDETHVQNTQVYEQLTNSPDNTQATPIDHHVTIEECRKYYSETDDTNMPSKNYASSMMAKYARVPNVNLRARLEKYKNIFNDLKTNIPLLVFCIVVIFVVFCVIVSTIIKLNGKQAIQIILTGIAYIMVSTIGKKIKLV